MDLVMYSDEDLVSGRKFMKVCGCVGFFEGIREFWLGNRGRGDVVSGKVMIIEYFLLSFKGKMRRIGGVLSFVVWDYLIFGYMV